MSGHVDEARFRREQFDFDALFRAHHAEIVRYLAARLGSREEAADVASEVFIEAWRRVPGLRWRGRPVLAWLYRVAANMAADRMSARSREPVATAAAAETAAGRDEATAVIEREALRRALATLPPDHALAVHLRLVEGYPFADVARVMGRTVGASQMLVLRAGRELRAALEGRASMHRGDERELARLLADALDGGEPPTGELREIVQVLEAAAAEARFGVSEEETEQVLREARPSPRIGRRLWPAAAVAAAVVAAALALLLAGPFGSGPAADVQAQALAALGGRGTVLEVVERIRPGPAGGFAASTRTGWIDPTRGRAVWTQTTGAGIVVDRTLVQRGRITRYDQATNSAVVARSCAALATGCASAVDPIAVYRRALIRFAATETERVTFHGRPAYRFALPAQRLPDAARVAQVVTVDARTLLPERIEWRLRRVGGRPRAEAVIDIREVRAAPRELAPQDAFTLTLPPRTAITELSAPGRRVRALGARRLTLAGARALRPAIDWLGPAFAGHRLEEIVLVRYGDGAAVRLDYGPIVVWNYGAVIPPPLLATVGVPVKQFPVGSRTARLYETVSDRLALEIDRPGGTVAVTGSGSASSFAAVARLRPITRR